MIFHQFLWQYVQEEKSRIEQRYLKLQDTMRALQDEIQSANFCGAKVIVMFLRNEKALWVRIMMFNAKWPTLQLYHGENKVHYDELMMVSALY